LDADRTTKSSAAIEDYCKNPNPDALLVFVADHISIPADVRRMEMTDKERYERIRETLGQYCGIVELARVEEAKPSAGSANTAPRRGVKIDADARPRTGRRARRRHDDDLQRTGES
jgi:DNA polymerase-3 subunit delta